MKYRIVVDVSRVETWEVEADNETEARLKALEDQGEVSCDEEKRIAHVEVISDA